MITECQLILCLFPSPGPEQEVVRFGKVPLSEMALQQHGDSAVTDLKRTFGF